MGGVAAVAITVLQALPTLASLTTEVLSFINQAIEDIKNLDTQGNVSPADIQAIVDKVKARSAEIQAIP